MSSRPPGKGNKDLVAKQGSPSDEELLLEEFLNDFESEEIGFNEWTNVHRDLDLRINVTVNESQLGGNSQVLVTFTKTVDKKKIKSSLNLVIPKNAKNGQEILLHGHGDRKGPEKGDLIVTLKVIAT